ncbi:MAG: LPS biosynthesis protein [Hoeflea sp.]|uniref:glycosyltransferase family 2 protein n=1 Tax=Hoeflea sp. TaxID=1940281 RepID=UPI000C115498|nr:glycosyltransferase family 2 protein [Hoeflea sp.]PHR22747.1 MAG: LPS biosynthesis protein [Hoeflea sp.]
MKPTISAVIITRNEAEMLPGLLESLTFCDEIVVVDSHSDDATRDIAASFDAKVITRDFNGFGDQKEFARAQAGCDWVLSMDADERVPPSLAEEIVSTLADPAFDAYQVPRLSYFLGKPFRHSGWWPDAPLRLFRRDAARFNSKLVHEFAETDRPTGTLSNHMDHFTVRSLEQALAKGQHYSALGAQQLEKTGRRVTLLSPFGHAAGAFVKTYVLKRGFLGGVEGLVNAWIHGQTVFWKYMIVYVNRRAELRSRR